MRDEGNSCRPKARVFIRAGHAGGHFCVKLTLDDADVNAAFLE